MRKYIYINQRNQQRLEEVYRQMVKERRAIKDEPWDSHIADILEYLLNEREQAPTN